MRQTKLLPGSFGPETHLGAGCTLDTRPFWPRQWAAVGPGPAPFEPGCKLGPFGLSVCLVFCLSVCLSVRPPVCPSVCISVHLSVRLSACLPVYLSVCRSVCVRTVLSEMYGIPLCVSIVCTSTGPLSQTY